MKLMTTSKTRRRVAGLSRLDDISDLTLLDPGGMYGAISEFPNQIRKAIEIGVEIKLDPDNFSKVDNIIVCGMGGSAIGGDLARSVVDRSLTIPFYICRNYDLPAFARNNSLVIGSSYSGNTEETLSAFGQAVQRGCKLLALTTGGQLGDMAAKHKIPVAFLPEGLQPRAALGYSFVPLMIMLHKIGLAEYESDDLSRLADFMESRISVFGSDTDSEGNLAKQLAMRLYGRIPIIYSGREVTDAVAIRIKGQISENAKMLAFANQFPELNHNELVGWKIINSLRDYLRVIILRDIDDHSRIAASMDIVKTIIEKSGVDVIELHSEGDDRLQRVFSLIQLGDFFSFYLAILNKVDPTPVESIEALKQELAKIS